MMNDGETKDRASGSANDLRIKRADRAFAEDDAGAAEGFGRTEDGAEVAGILKACEDNDWTQLQAFANVLERKSFQANESGHALRGFAGDEAVE